MKMIETNRLLIQEVAETDIEAIIELESHKDNRDFLWIGTYEEHKAEIVDKNHLLLVFRQKTDNLIIGYALVRLDFKSEIFELRRIAISAKGMGYGRESMIALLKHAFEEMNINRFWLDVYPDNVIGIKLYESLGMHRDGILRQNYKAKRGCLDQIIYSMLKEEYFKNSAPIKSRRIQMKCDLNAETSAVKADNNGHVIRNVTFEDQHLLAESMFEAYKGTVDQMEENVEEALVEVKNIMKDGYGPFLKEASFLIERDGLAASVILVNLYEGKPLITEIYTRKEYYKQGMAGALVQASRLVLSHLGYKEFILNVMRENTGAISLYEKLGFKRVEE